MHVFTLRDARMTTKPGSRKCHISAGDLSAKHSCVNASRMHSSNKHCSCHYNVSCLHERVPSRGCLQGPWLRRGLRGCCSPERTGSVCLDAALQLILRLLREDAVWKERLRLVRCARAGDLVAAGCCWCCAGEGNTWWMRSETLSSHNKTLLGDQYVPFPPITYIS